MDLNLQETQWNGLSYHYKYLGDNLAPRVLFLAWPGRVQGTFLYTNFMLFYEFDTT